MKLFHNHQSLRGLTRIITIEPSLSCHSEGAFHYCHSEGAQRPKNLNVAQGKLPEEESLEILRFAQNDIGVRLDTLSEGGTK
ncbi:MAG: hypothetical protein FJ005_09610 [Chloroflexi bacterium]|nr:hypothetical protein [Chloroflexota bacterium]